MHIQEVQKLKLVNSKVSRYLAELKTQIKFLENYLTNDEYGVGDVENCAGEIEALARLIVGGVDEIY